MRLLITGGKGQLGSSLREILESRGDHESKFIDIDELDITERHSVEDFFSENSFDILINCAAYTAVDKAETERSLATAVNVSAIENLATAAKKYGFRVIHISTDYVFDGKSHIPYKETDQPNPRTVYGKTKLEGERMLQSILPDSIIIRTAWLYSLYGRNFFLTMKGKALRREEARVVDDQIGTPTYAPDLAAAIMKIIDSDNWEAGIFHFSNEGKTTWFDFTRRIYELYGLPESLVSPIKSSELKNAAPRPAYSLLDKSKISSVYDIKIPGWEESLKRAVEKAQGR